MIYCRVVELLKMYINIIERQKICSQKTWFQLLLYRKKLFFSYTPQQFNVMSRLQDIKLIINIKQDKLVYYLNFEIRTYFLMKI